MRVVQHLRGEGPSDGDSDAAVGREERSPALGWWVVRRDEPPVVLVIDMAQSEMRLHLVVILSDGRQMLATCAASTTVRQLTEQLEDELAQTFRAALQLRYLGKVVTAPQGGSAGSGDLPPHLALSAAARAGDLLKDGDTVLAVAAEPPPERPRDSGDSPEPELDSVSACAARWEEVERRAQRGRRHIASSLATLGPQEPRAVVSEEGRRLLGGLVQAGSSTAGCEPALAQAAVAALASATAIPQLAGLQATTVLRSADDISRGKELDAEGSDKSVAPTVASLLLSLCRSPSTDVRRSAEGVLRHLQVRFIPVVDCIHILPALLLAYVSNAHPYPVSDCKRCCLASLRCAHLDRYVQAEARAEQARADPSYSKQQHRIGNQAATGSSRSDSSGRCCATACFLVSIFVCLSCVR